MVRTADMWGGGYNIYHPLACALRQDLSVLPQGDLTEVGEKGFFFFVIHLGQYTSSLCP